MADQLGLRALSVWGYSSLGEAYAGSGRKEKARKNLKNAESVSREMGMEYWTSKAQRALKRL